MKILLDARLYGLENAGLGRYVLNLVDSLSKQDKANEYIVLLRKKYYESLRLPSNWKKILADWQHYSFTEQIKLPFIIKNENPDLTHFPHFNVPIFFNGNYVLTIHDTLMHNHKGPDTTTLNIINYAIKRFGYRLAFDTGVKRAEKIIVPSNAVKADLVKSYKNIGDKIEVVYEGVETNIVPIADLKPIKPYFIYTGNAYPHKNLKRLLQAMVCLNKDMLPNAYLYIASSRNIFTTRLKTLIKELGADRFVRLLGFVDDARLAGLYKNATAFVFPSLSEGFGLPGLEAMAQGTVVLASDIPVFKEIYGDNVIYFNRFDFSSIQKRMREVLSMDAKRKSEIIKKGKEFVKRYSWVKMAGETIKIYESCTGIRSGK